MSDIKLMMERAVAMVEETYKLTGYRAEVTIALPEPLYERMLLEHACHGMARVAGFPSIMWHGVKFEVLR